MESTLIGERIKPSERSCRPRLLVTDDYKFFKGFARSAYAQDVLHDLVVQVLRLKDGISVLLARYTRSVRPYAPTGPWGIVLDIILLYHV